MAHIPLVGDETEQNDKTTSQWKPSSPVSGRNKIHSSIEEMSKSGEMGEEEKETILTI